MDVKLRCNSFTDRYLPSIFIQMDPDERDNDRAMLVAFLSALPDSVARLRPDEARYFMRQCSSDGIEHSFNLLETSKWAELLGTAGFCLPTDFFPRMAQALGIAFNLVDINHILNMADMELVKWVKLFTSLRPSLNSGTGPQFRFTLQGVSLCLFPSTLQVAVGEVWLEFKVDQPIGPSTVLARVCP